jgi:hypothetical protein
MWPNLPFHCGLSKQEGARSEKDFKKDKFKKEGKSKGYIKKKKYGQDHIGEEWNSDEESSSSGEEEEVANIAIQSTSSSRLFANLPDDSFTPTCFMAKGDKVHLFDSKFDDNVDDEYSMKNKMISEFCLNGYNIITKLMEKLEKRKATLDAQEDFLILEKERNLELQGLLTNKDEMISNLTKEASVAKAIIKDKEHELSNAKVVLIDVANAKQALELSISSLTVQKQELQVQLEKCKNSSTTPLVVDSNASSSNISTCKHCVKYHATCCLTNHARKVGSKTKVKHVLRRSSSNDGLKKVEPKYKHLRHNNGKKDLGTTHIR